jgi:predicted nucleotidyltransferase
VTLLLTPGQRKTLEEIQSALGDHQWVLIGATALGAQIRMKRSTYDVDIVVVLGLADAAGLLVAAGYRRDPKQPQRWYARDDAVIDVLPVTAETIAEGELRFEAENVRMSLVGFDLALRHTATHAVPGSSHDVRIATWPALLVLKMVAWLDRPAERPKDLADIASALEYALADDDAIRWDDAHPVGASDLEHEDQAAFYAGLQVGGIIAPHHRVAIDRFLGMVGDPDSRWFAMMLREANYAGDNRDETLTRRLAAFRRGLDHRSGAMSRTEPGQ